MLSAPITWTGAGTKAGADAEELPGIPGKKGGIACGCVVPNPPFLSTSVVSNSGGAKIVGEYVITGWFDVPECVRRKIVLAFVLGYWAECFLRIGFALARHFQHSYL